MPIRGVTFDLDGLMFNTEVVFNEVMHALLSRRQKVATPGLLKQMMGRRAQESLQLMIELHQLDATVGELADESQTLFFELAESRLAPMPGLEALLARIDACGIPKGVATSSGRSYVESVLGRFNLLDAFDSILTAEDVVHGKPHPEIYLKAAERLALPPHEMLVLEDSEAGTNAAAAAGAVIVSVPHEFSAHHNFERAVLIASSLDDPRVMDMLAPLG